MNAWSANMPLGPYKLLKSTEKYRVLPVTVAIAQEFGTLFPILRNPVDTAITATARVHGLRLVTSDDRIIKANVVSTIE